MKPWTSMREPCHCLDGLNIRNLWTKARWLPKMPWPWNKVSRNPLKADQRWTSICKNKKEELRTRLLLLMKWRQNIKSFLLLTTMITLKSAMERIWPRLQMLTWENHCWFKCTWICALPTSILITTPWLKRCATMDWRSLKTCLSFISEKLKLFRLERIALLSNFRLPWNALTPLSLREATKKYFPQPMKTFWKCWTFITQPKPIKLVCSTWRLESPKFLPSTAATIKKSMKEPNKSMR